MIHEGEDEHQWHDISDQADDLHICKLAQQLATACVRERPCNIELTLHYQTAAVGLQDFALHPVWRVCNCETACRKQPVCNHTTRV